MNRRPHMLLTLLLVAGTFVPAGELTTPTGQARLLELRHQRQEANMCVPTSASMVLDFYGESRDPAELKKLSRRKNSSFAGTYYRDLIKGLKKIGYRWNENCFSISRSGFKAGMQLIRSTVEEGRPVLVGLSTTRIGHTVVLVGYDDARREIHLVDPARRAPGRRTLTYSKFRKTWREKIIDRRCVVLSSPKPEPSGS